MKKYLAIASLATACALLAGCSSDRADEIYARLEGQGPALQSLSAEALAGDGLADDQLPEGVEVALDRAATAVSDLCLYDAPSPVGAVVGSVPAGARVRVKGVVRRLDGARWYCVSYQGLSGYACGGLDFSADSAEPMVSPEETPAPEPTPPPEATFTPEPETTLEATPSPDPLLEPQPSETLAPTSTPEITPSPEPSQAPEPDATPEPVAEPSPEVTPDPAATPDPTAAPELDWPDEAAVSATGIVQKDGVRLHAHPSTDAEAIATADSGTSLPAVSRVRMPDGDWYGVLWQGEKAYVRGDMIELCESPAATLKPTSTPEVTIAPEATAAPDITATPEPAVAPDATVTPEPTPTPEATAATEDAQIPEPTPTPEPSGTPEVVQSPD